MYMSHAAFAPRAGGTVRELLVVDDRRSNLQLLARRLSHLGYRSATCAGGADALTRLARRRFDLVLLDQAMPGMSGVETVQAIRAAAEGGDVPVLMMIDQGEDGEEALAAGADDVIAKPFAADALGAAIERLFARQRMLAALSRVA